MELKVKRIYRGNNYTIGKMYINDIYFCDILEDKDRELDDSMTEEEIKDKKVYSQTAIPTGTYKVELTYSPKFKRTLPILLNVKGFSGIRIHAGNTHQHTSGCLLCGNNSEKGKVLQSRLTEAKLINRLREATDDIYITIE